MGLKERCIRMYNSLKGHDDHEIEIKDFAGMLSTYLSIYNFFEKKECTEWNCGLFVAPYAEFLSDRLQIPSSDFNSGLHHTKYPSLL
ncbi:hypothetical protein T459_20113 [Capsicum annuum]|uniref:Ubiquitin-like protease family profile domain-containing protein n=1 Tax=Capsicum annuum TaxID=4072 RepID=A0A2G2Z3V9_CAPAN|nr:hypothetical protein T459_20113 [Capsicum annuum]